ncbi:patatin-like phospholipase family protein [Photorhabdus heterorhabditis]|uniref:Patatin-like phospholipase family protein n=1 Tax=Photorhabdus heterorhabditis TaxID=880156 RepID=A0A5B0X6L2_9GAMM|nr:patatin-like phospholipase family protein [Photorhabdus heterorhabditis]KAA1194893.1 patatin-like phospholipase family protein [Photorhabdus heterorhabditis]
MQIQINPLKISSPAHEATKNYTSPTNVTKDPVVQSLTNALKSAAATLRLPAETAVRNLIQSPAARGNATVMAEDAGKRHITLKQFENGSVSLELNRPPLTSLVLSGGGAKGAAYPGAIKALEEQGMLKGIRTMSGSSAGGITAALLASGMNAAGFKKLSDEMDLISLLDKPNSKTQSNSPPITRSGKQFAGPFGALGKLVDLLYKLLPRIQSKAIPLEKVIRQESAKSMLKQIAAHPELSNKPDITSIRDRLSNGGGVTFKDLDILSKHIPEIKSLNITGTAMFDGKPQMVVFSSTLTPYMEIARAAHISGSFPIVFSKPEEHSQPFQTEQEITQFQDGGVMLNVPVPEMINPHHQHSPIRQNDNLILEFEGEKVHVPAKGSLGSTIVDWIVGAPVTARSALQVKDLKTYKEQTVTVPLKTEMGDFSNTLSGTLNFTMSGEIKNHLQEKLSSTVTEHLQNREKQTEQHRFDNLEQALLSLDDEMFSAVTAQSREATSDIAQFRAEAREFLSELAAVIISEENDHQLTITPFMQSTLQKLDALATTPERKAWIAGELNQSDNPIFQRLLSASAGKKIDSPVLGQALTEARRRDVANIALNITREVVYPSLFRMGQPASNIALLRKVEHSLARATTAEQVNQALTELADNYGARMKPWKKPFSSTTVELAKAWMIKTA